MKQFETIRLFAVIIVAPPELHKGKHRIYLLEGGWLKTYLSLSWLLARSILWIIRNIRLCPEELGILCWGISNVVRKKLGPMQLCNLADSYVNWLTKKHNAKVTSDCGVEYIHCTTDCTRSCCCCYYIVWSNYRRLNFVQILISTISHWTIRYTKQGRSKRG